MMTREEAIKVLNNFPIDFRNSGGFEAMEALKIAILALRPVSREQVEKVWRGCDMCNGIGAYDRYAKCLTKTLLAKYCPHCGAPLTDEAVQMVMERMEALHESP